MALENSLLDREMVDQIPTGLTQELQGDLIPPESAGDIDDDVEVPEEVQEWVDETKGVERVVVVAISIRKPRTAEWISDQAMVSEQTARDHLQTFADIGIVASFTSSGVTRYHADEGFLHYREVSRFVDQYTKDELESEIEISKGKLEELKDEYDVSRPDGLRAKAAEEATEIDKIRELKKLAAEWETLIDRLEILEDAVRRFDKFEERSRAVA